MDAEGTPAGDGTSVLRVGLLGPVDVAVGGAALTPQQRALLAFLAASPGVHREAVIDALWDGRAVSDSRFLNLMSETRRRVGRRYLPEASSGHYRLADADIDVDRFRRYRAAAASAADDGTAMAALQRALGLVRGEPLGTPGGRYWNWASERIHQVAEITSDVVDVGTELGARAVACEDAALAIWAYRQTLRASPFDERLFTELMGVHRSIGQLGMARRLREIWEANARRLNG